MLKPSNEAANTDIPLNRVESFIYTGPYVSGAVVSLGTAESSYAMRFPIRAVVFLANGTSNGGLQEPSLEDGVSKTWFEGFRKAGVVRETQPGSGRYELANPDILCNLFPYVNNGSSK